MAPVSSHIPLENSFSHAPVYKQSMCDRNSNTVVHEKAWAFGIIGSRVLIAALMQF